VAKIVCHRFPHCETTNITKDGRAGSDESKIVLADMSEVVLGEVDGISVQVGNAASHTDPDDATVKNAFEIDTTLVRVITHNDLIAKHGESVAAHRHGTMQWKIPSPSWTRVSDFLLFRCIARDAVRKYAAARL
jgi:hypothetical protein